MRYRNYYFPFVLDLDTPVDMKQADSWQFPESSGNIYSYPENLANALALILQAVSGENEDSLFYTYLSEIAPSEEESQIISGIRDNEISHRHMFSQIHQDITGTGAVLPDAEQFVPQFVPPSSYCEGLKRAILGEQHAVQNYRQILFAMQTRIHINMLTEIITDEIRHGSLFNYLYARNGCNV